MGGRQMMQGMMGRMQGGAPRPPAPGMGPGAVPAPANPGLAMGAMGAGPFPHGDLDLRNLTSRAAEVMPLPVNRGPNGRNFYFLQLAQQMAAAVMPNAAPGQPPVAGAANVASPAITQNVPAAPGAPDGARKG
jgi:hypothetical protein